MSGTPRADRLPARRRARARRTRHAHAVGLRRRSRRAPRAGDERRRDDRGADPSVRYTARTSPRISRATAGRSPRPDPRWSDVISRLRARNEWKFFAVLPKADRGLAIGVVGRRCCCGARCPRCSRSPWACSSARCSSGDSLGLPLTLVGIVFVAVPGADADPPGGERQPRQPHRGVALRPAACVPAWARRAWRTSRTPSSRTTSRWRATSTSASPGRRSSISMDFIASGLVEMVGGLASAVVLFGYAWWAPLVLGGAWLATHWLLRESAVWRDRNTDEVRAAQRHADYAYRLAVDPPAAKEVRLFGLADWAIDRFIVAPPPLLRAAVARRPGCASGRCVWSAACSCSAANVARVLVARRRRRRRHASASAGSSCSRRRAVGTSMIAFGGLNWALDGARRAGGARAAPRARRWRRPARCPSGARAPADRAARRARSASATSRFAYPAPSAPVLEGFDLDHPGRHVAGDRRPERRGQDHARQAAVPPLRPAVAARSRSTASTCASSTSTRGGRG